MQVILILEIDSLRGGRVEAESAEDSAHLSEDGTGQAGKDGWSLIFGLIF